jgi:hypothetical protein
VKRKWTGAAPWRRQGARIANPESAVRCYLRKIHQTEPMTMITLPANARSSMRELVRCAVASYSIMTSQP